MIDYFQSEESRLFIFNEPLICHFCAHDIFIPYETYHNVEKPGIKVRFVHNTAICTQCGFVMEFVDPSDFDAENGAYMWAFDQQLLHEQPPVMLSPPTLDEEKKEAQKKCIYAALQLLIQNNNASKELLTLLNEERFFDIIKSFDPQYEIEFQHMVTQECLVILLTKILKYYSADSNKLIQILQDKGDVELEAFLKSKLK